VQTDTDTIKCAGYAIEGDGCGVAATTRIVPGHGVVGNSGLSLPPP
jgi:hypothetical protein